VILRDYQIAAMDACRAEYARGAKRVLLTMSTGAGKTATASEIMRSAIDAGNRCAFYVHRREVVNDTAARLRRAGLRTGVVMAGEPVDRDAPVSVCSIQTVDARGELPPAALVVVDECHHATASTYRALLAAYPDAWILGLSATPVRADGAALGDAFEVLVRGPSAAELTARGVLAPCDAIVAPSSSREGIAMDEAEAVARYCGEQQTLVFVSTVARAKELAARTPDAAAIYGGMPTQERDRVLQAFRVGAIRTIYNCSVLTEGTDLPMASRVVLARTCGHVGLYLQIVGRVLRADPARPDKRALIVDLGDNVRTHGMPADPREFSLEGEPVRSKAASPRLCPTCGAVRRGEDPSCWRCETVYPLAKPVKVRAESLVPFDGDTSYSATKQGYYDRLAPTAKVNGYKPGWVGHRFAARFGHWPTGYVSAHRVSA